MIKFAEDFIVDLKVSDDLMFLLSVNNKGLLGIYADTFGASRLGYVKALSECCEADLFKMPEGTFCSKCVVLDEGPIVLVRGLTLNDPIKDSDRSDTPPEFDELVRESFTTANPLLLITLKNDLYRICLSLCEQSRYYEIHRTEEIKRLSPSGLLKKCISDVTEKYNAG